MSSQHRPAKAQLRRSLSEQLRDSTAKAWDLLWRNVRERRLSGQSRRAAAAATCPRPSEGRPRRTSRPRRHRGLPSPRGRPGEWPGRLAGTHLAAAAAPERGDLGGFSRGGTGSAAAPPQTPARVRLTAAAQVGVQAGRTPTTALQETPARVLVGAGEMVPQAVGVRTKTRGSPTPEATSEHLGNREG